MRQQQLSRTGRHRWVPRETEVQWAARETAFVIFDMWSWHPCPSAVERVNALAVLIDRTAKAARKQGVTIVHALADLPQSTLKEYAAHPARQYVTALSKRPLPALLKHDDPTPPLAREPGGASQGCDTARHKEPKQPRTGHAAIEINAHDVLITGGDPKGDKELYAALQDRGIKNIVYMGVHLNMYPLTPHTGLTLRPAAHTCTLCAGALWGGRTA